MRFIAVGSFSKGLAGFMKNQRMTGRQLWGEWSRAGGKLDELYLTRGSHDVVAIGEALDFETMAAIKILILAGAFAHMEL